MTTPAETLPSALAACRIELPGPQVELLDRYCRLVWEWNEKLNLTRHTGYEKFVARDLVDSLALAGFLQQGERVLDVGTGGGVPGVVLAVLRPDLKVTLAESVAKRAKAVADIVEKLGLAVPVEAARAEEILAERSFNTLVIRAVARLAKLLRWFKPHWGRFDRLMLVKGPSWVDERGEARHYGLLNELALRKLSSYPIPGVGAESVILQVCPPDRLAEGRHCRLREIP